MNWSGASALVLTRRRVLAGVLASVVATRRVDAQPAGTVHRVGYLHEAPEVWDLPRFRRAMADLGYVEGKNLLTVGRWVRGSTKSTRGLAEELLAARVEIIVAAGDPAVRGAREATATVPTVMAPASFAVERGFVKSAARPGGNVTGVIFESEHEIGVKLALLQDVVPTAQTLAFLTVAGGDAVERAAVERAASSRGFRVATVTAQSREWERAFDAAKREGVDAIFVGRDQVLQVARRVLVDLTASYRIPAVWPPWILGIDAALISCGPRIPDLNARVASFVDRIIKGAHPGDLAVEQPTKLELTLNVRTATALGLTIPPALRLRADHVVE